jgi:hypothetical protein
MWIDVGTWNIVFPNSLKISEALQKNNISSSEKLFFSHMLGRLPIHAKPICG